MCRTESHISMGLPIIGIIWAGGILIVSFLMLFDMPKKPHTALLCIFGVVAAFLKIMFCGFLLRALKQKNASECKIWLVVNIILTVIIEALIFPVYFLNSPIWTPFDITATAITAAYSFCLVLFVFLLPAQPEVPEVQNIRLIEDNETI